MIQLGLVTLRLVKQENLVDFKNPCLSPTAAKPLKDLEAPSLLPGGTSPGPPQKPKIPNANFFWLDFGDFGFWILDRYVAILLVKPPVVQILDFGFWIVM